MQDNDSGSSYINLDWPSYIAAHYFELLRQVQQVGSSRCIHDKGILFDAFHDTIIWIMDHADRFDPTRGTLPAHWFVGVAQIMMQRHLYIQRWERQITSTEGASQTDIFERLAHANRQPSDLDYLRNQCDEIVTQLTSQQKKLAYYLRERYPRTKIAQELGISYDAARKQISRLLRKIRSLRGQLNG